MSFADVGVDAFLPRAREPPPHEDEHAGDQAAEDADGDGPGWGAHLCGTALGSLVAFLFASESGLVLYLVFGCVFVGGFWGCGVESAGRRGDLLGWFWRWTGSDDSLFFTCCWVASRDAVLSVFLVHGKEVEC